MNLTLSALVKHLDWYYGSPGNFVVLKSGRSGAILRSWREDLNAGEVQRMVTNWVECMLPNNQEVACTVTVLISSGRKQKQKIIQPDLIDLVAYEEQLMKNWHMGLGKIPVRAIPRIAPDGGGWSDEHMRLMQMNRVEASAVLQRVFSPEAHVQAIDRNRKKGK